MLRRREPDHPESIISVLASRNAGEKHVGRGLGRNEAGETRHLDRRPPFARGTTKMLSAGFWVPVSGPFDFGATRRLPVHVRPTWSSAIRVGLLE